MNESNGIPTDSVIHPEVEWITVRLPVFTGEVSERMPDYIDKLAFVIMSPDQKAGLNRVVEGYHRVYPNPAADMSRPLIARWVFAQIGKTFEASKDNPRHPSMAKTKK